LEPGQAQRREIGLRRAATSAGFYASSERGIRGFVGSVVFALFLAFRFYGTSLELERIGSESAWFTAVIALLAIAIGAGYLLHDGRRFCDRLSLDVTR